jgi:hypothetical protein
MISIPMTTEGLVIGALNHYAKAANAFDGDAVSIAEVVAAHASLASQVAAAFFGHKHLAENLAEAMRSRATIEQAKGIMMQRSHCGPDEAFDQLVELASSSSRKLRDVATAVVAEVASRKDVPD